MKSILQRCYEFSIGVPSKRRYSDLVFRVASLVAALRLRAHWHQGTDKNGVYLFSIDLLIGLLICCHGEISHQDCSSILPSKVTKKQLML